MWQYRFLVWSPACRFHRKKKIIRIAGISLARSLACLQDWPEATHDSRLHRALFQTDKLKERVQASNGVFKLNQRNLEELVALLGGDSDVTVIARANGTYETLLYGEGGTTPQAYSQRGTYTCSNNIAHLQVTERYDGSNWVSFSETSDIPYSISGDGNTLTLQMDLSYPPDGIADATWTLTRQ